MTEKTFTPVEFYNAHFPNQVLVDGADRPNDPESSRRIKFIAGYFRATEPWQVALIEQGCRDRSGNPYAHPADMPEQTHPKTGWVCKSSRAYAEYQHIIG